MTVKNRDPGSESAYIHSEFCFFPLQNPQDLGGTT